MLRRAIIKKQEVKDIELFGFGGKNYKLECTTAVLNIISNFDEFDFTEKGLNYLEEEDPNIRFDIEECDEVSDYLELVLKYAKKDSNILSKSTKIDNENGDDKWVFARKNQIDYFHDPEFIGSAIELLSKNKKVASSFFEYSLDCIQLGLETYKDSKIKSSLNKLKNSIHKAISYIDANIHLVEADKEEMETIKGTYVAIDVENHEQLYNWFKDQGIEPIVSTEMHTTIAYSRKEFNLDNYIGRIIIKPEQFIGIEELGNEGCAVLKYNSDELQSRFNTCMSAGATYDYDSYIPHTTFALNLTKEQISKLKLPDFDIVLVNEHTDELNLEWKSKIDNKDEESMMDKRDNEGFMEGVSAIVISPILFLINYIYGNGFISAIKATYGDVKQSFKDGTISTSSKDQKEIDDALKTVLKNPSVYKPINLQTFCTTTGIDLDVINAITGITEVTNGKTLVKGLDKVDRLLSGYIKDHDGPLSVDQLISNDKLKPIGHKLDAGIPLLGNRKISDVVDTSMIKAEIAKDKTIGLTVDDYRYSIIGIDSYTGSISIYLIRYVISGGINMMYYKLLKLKINTKPKKLITGSIEFETFNTLIKKYNIDTKYKDYLSGFHTLSEGVDQKTQKDFISYFNKFDKSTNSEITSKVESSLNFNMDLYDEWGMDKEIDIPASSIARLYYNMEFNCYYDIEESLDFGLIPYKLYTVYEIDKLIKIAYNNLIKKSKDEESIVEQLIYKNELSTIVATPIDCMDNEAFAAITGLVANGFKKVSSIVTDISDMFVVSNPDYSKLTKGFIFDKNKKFQDVYNTLVGVPAGYTGYVLDVSKYVVDNLQYINTLNKELDNTITILSMYINSADYRESFILDLSAVKAIETIAKELFDSNKKYITSSKEDSKPVGKLIRSANEIDAVVENLKEASKLLDLKTLESIRFKMKQIDNLVSTMIDNKNVYSKNKLMEIAKLIDAIISLSNGVSTVVYLKNSSDIILEDIRVIL